MRNPIKWPLFTAKFIIYALWQALLKLSPTQQFRNPTRFCVYICSLLCTALSLQCYYTNIPDSNWFLYAITAWLWLNVLFANFTEASIAGLNTSQTDDLPNLNEPQNSPNIMPLNILLTALCIILLMSSASLLAFSMYPLLAAAKGSEITLPIMIALFACIVPTHIVSIAQRNTLTVFNICNHLSKYVVLMPAVLASTYPALHALNIMQLHSSQTAVLSTLIYNALLMICWIPLTLHVAKYRALASTKLLWRNVIIYGLAGLLLPFIAIKFIDMILTTFGLI